MILFDRATWNSDTTGKCSDATPKLVFQSDGNLVLYCGSKALWDSGTVATHPGLCRALFMQNDGLLAMYNARNQSGVWASDGSIPMGFGSSNLTSPHSLAVGEHIVQSYDKQYELSIEAGELVLREWQKSIIWRSNGGKPIAKKSHLKMQEDGNLVL